MFDSRPLKTMVGLALLASLTAPATAGTHKDERLGFQVMVPSGWEQVPLQTTEQWIVAKYVSPKMEYWTDPSLGYTFEFQPELRIIAFIDEVVNKSDFEDYDYKKKDDEDKEDEEEKEKTDEEKARDRRIKLSTRIYRDYEDYLSGTLSEGYYLTDDPVEKKVNGLPVECFDVTLEKQARRVTTWVFDTEIAHIAIEYDFYAHQLKKERKGMERSFKSFKLIERTESLGLDEIGTFVSFADLAAKTPKDREKYRRADQDRTWEQMTATMPDGWDAKEISGVRILSCVDDRYNKKMVDRIKAVHGWLDKTFPNLGPEEYVRYPLLRICKDSDERNTFLNVKGNRYSGFQFNFSTELVTYKDMGGATGFELRRLNNSILRRWFQERDYRLRLSLPPWLGTGLGGLLFSAQVKGSKLKHAPSDFEREFVRQVVREKTALSARELMLMSSKDAEDSDVRGSHMWAQATAFTRFMTVGSGSKGKYKGIANDYLDNINAVLVEIEEEDRAERERKKKEKEAAEEEDEDDDEEEEEERKPKTEEEEEAELKERQARFQAKQRRILEHAIDRTFEGWSDKQWAAFESAYAKSIK